MNESMVAAALLALVSRFSNIFNVSMASCVSRLCRNTIALFISKSAARTPYAEDFMASTHLKIVMQIFETIY